MSKNPEPGEMELGPDGQYVVRCGGCRDVELSELRLSGKPGGRRGFVEELLVRMKWCRAIDYDRKWYCPACLAFVDSLPRRAR